MTTGGVLQTGTFPKFLEDRKNATQRGIDMAIKEAKYPAYMMDGGAATRMTERMEDMEGIGMLERWQENTNRPLKSPNLGYAQVISQMQFAAEVRITKQMRKFKRWDILNETLKQIKQRVPQTLDFLFVNYLAQGESTSNPTQNGVPIINLFTGDGESLFDQAHTWRNGGATWSNHYTSSSDLTEAVIFEIHKLAARWKDHNYIPTDASLRSLIIPVELERDAIIVMKSLKDPTTANNAYNTAKDFLGGGYTVLKYLTSTTEWYAKTSEEGLPTFKWGWKPEVETRNPDTDSASVQAISVDFSIGHSAPIHAHGMIKVG